MKKGHLTVVKDIFTGQLIIQPIKGLVLKQPFAGLMLFDKIETRKWYTDYRGPVLHTAAKKSYTEKELDSMLTAYGQAIVAKNRELPCFSLTGHAIAIGELYECRRLRPDDCSYVNFDPNLFAHVYRNVRPIEPFAISGTLGLFNVSSQQELSQIKYLD